MPSIFDALVEIIHSGTLGSWKERTEKALDGLFGNRYAPSAAKAFFPDSTVLFLLDRAAVVDHPSLRLRNVKAILRGLALGRIRLTCSQTHWRIVEHIATLLLKLAAEFWWSALEVGWHEMDPPFQNSRLRWITLPLIAGLEMDDAGRFDAGERVQANALEQPEQRRFVRAKHRLQDQLSRDTDVAGVYRQLPLLEGKMP